MAQPTVAHAIAATAARHADRTALVVDDVQIDYGELAQRVTRVAARLAERGAVPGSRVCVSSAAKLDLVVGVLAAWTAGAAAVPLSDDDEVEARELVAAVEPSAVVGPPPGKELLSRVAPSTAFVASADGGGRDVWLPQAGAEQSALLLHSSGTTSATRKLIDVPHSTYAHVVRAISEIVPAPGGAVEYLMSPPHHAFGLGRVCATLCAGGTLVLDEGPFNPLRALAALRERGCAVLSGVSSAFALLLERLPDQLADYGRHLRVVEISSQPMTERHKQQLLDVLPAVRPVMTYGLTEAMRSTALDFRAHPEKLASVGQPGPGVSVAVLDDDGRELPAGSEGEIALRGAHLARGYWGRPDLWAERLSDGWFKTGDLGRLDGDGFLYFVGRRDDVINSGGHKIAPEEVEALVADLLPGEAYCVVSQPDAVLGEVPVLFVEGEQDDGRATALAAAMAGAVPAWKRPREVRFLEALPRTANGKILRRTVRELARAPAETPRR